MNRLEKGYILKDNGKWQLGFEYDLEDGGRVYMEYDTYDTYKEAWDDLVAVQKGEK